MPGHQMDQEEANVLLGFLSEPQEKSGQCRPGDEDILEDVLRDEGEEGAALLEIVTEAGLISELLC